MSAPENPALVPAEARRARGAVGALFFTNGALFANLVPRYPEIKAALDLDNAAYGVAIAAFAAGALTVGLAAAPLIRRFGSARVAAAGTIMVGLGALAAGVAPWVLAFALALFVAGALDAITDVAQNAHGLRVQRVYGRSILNTFHAIWSIGAVTGGVMAAGAIALGLPRGVHLTISAVLFSAVSLTALRFCLPGPDHDEPSSDDAVERARRNAPAPRTILVLVALAVIAIGGSTVEDAGLSWAAVYLSDSLSAPAELAATGFVALVGAQFVGRLLGDRLVDRFGQRAVARAGALIAAIGLGSALAFPSVPGSIAGFAAAGFGVATLIPAAMNQADRLPGFRPGTGLTLLSWLLRLGFLLSPPTIGAIADATDLRTGLLVVPVACVVVAVLAFALAPRHPAR